MRLARLDAELTMARQETASIKAEMQAGRIPFQSLNFFPKDVSSQGSSEDCGRILRYVSFNTYPSIRIAFQYISIRDIYVSFNTYLGSFLQALQMNQNQMCQVWGSQQKVFCFNRAQRLQVIAPTGGHWFQDMQWQWHQAQHYYYYGDYGDWDVGTCSSMLDKQVVCIDRAHCNSGPNSGQAQNAYFGCGGWAA